VAYLAAGSSLFPFTRAESTIVGSKWWSYNYSGSLTSFVMDNRKFLSGWVCAMILIPLTRLGTEKLLVYVLWKKDDGDKLYGLDHAILNVEVPPRSMWMNMGYWEACRKHSNRYLVFITDGS
jgi:hypothetical protein